MTQFSRREFLGLLALAGAGAACGNGSDPNVLRPVGDLTGATFNDVLAGREQSVQIIVPPYEMLPRREEHIAVVVLGQSDGAPVTGATGRVWYAKQRTEEVIGPFDLRALEDGFNERGIYGVTPAVPEDGTWFVLAEVQTGDGIDVGIGNVVVGMNPQNQMPRVGDRAIPVPTPTVRNARGVDPICTRDPICSMHRISLDVALDNGKPTVMIIGTPAWCTSRFCGPEVDIVERIAAENPGMDFIHMEVLKNDDEETVAAFTGQRPEGYEGTPLARGPIAWKLAEEPVIYFIDGRGVIQERLLGAVDNVAVRAGIETLTA